MTKIKINWVLVSLLVTAFLIVGLAGGLFTGIARAAIAAFSPSTCYTAAATTTLKYMTPGTATSTVTCELGAEGARTALITVQVNASSTLSVFKTYVEESMDGVDWYPTNVASTTVYSSANSMNFISSPYFSYTFASTSTIGGSAVLLTGVVGLQNRGQYSFDVPIRMKFIRAYTGLTGTNAGLWLQIVPKVDIN